MSGTYSVVLPLRRLHVEFAAAGAARRNGRLVAQVRGKQCANSSGEHRGCSWSGVEVVRRKDECGGSLFTLCASEDVIYCVCVLDSVSNFLCVSCPY
jgi:hypothetical protein